MLFHRRLVGRALCGCRWGQPLGHSPSLQGLEARDPVAAPLFCSEGPTHQDLLGSDLDGVGALSSKKLQALDQADVYPDLRCWKMEVPGEPGSFWEERGHSLFITNQALPLLALTVTGSFGLDIAGSTGKRGRVEKALIFLWPEKEGATLALDAPSPSRQSPPPLFTHRGVVCSLDRETMRHKRRHSREMLCNSAPAGAYNWPKPPPPPPRPPQIPRLGLQGRLGEGRSRGFL